MIAFLLSLLNEFPSHEFNFCSLERQRANILQTQGHNFFLLNKSGVAFIANTNLDAAT